MSSTDYEKLAAELMETITGQFLFFFLSLIMIHSLRVVLSFCRSLPYLYSNLARILSLFAWPFFCFLSVVLTFFSFHLIVLFCCCSLSLSFSAGDLSFEIISLLMTSFSLPLFLSVLFSLPFVLLLVSAR